MQLESTATEAPEETKAEPRSDGKDAGKNGIDWPTLIWIAGMHLAALAAPFYFYLVWSRYLSCSVLGDWMPRGDSWVSSVYSPTEVLLRRRPSDGSLHLWVVFLVRVPPLCG